MASAPVLISCRRFASSTTLDILGLQETKVQDSEFPLADVQALGFHVEFFGQKGHYGVALLSKVAPEFVQKGWPWDNEDAQKRMIHARYVINGKVWNVLNGYFPQGESRKHETKFPAKEKFYADLSRYLQETFSPDDRVIVMGDMNISPADTDIGIGEPNRVRWLKTGKCSFLPEEARVVSAPARLWFAGYLPQAPPRQHGTLQLV